MKLTQERLIEIIKEEYQNILNEKRVRLKTMDINFHSGGAQLLGMKGRMMLTKKAAKSLLYTLGKEWGRSITGN